MKSAKIMVLTLIGAFAFSLSASAQNFSAPSMPTQNKDDISDRDLAIDMMYVGIVSGMLNGLKEKEKNVQVVSVVLPYTLYKKEVDACFPYVVEEKNMPQLSECVKEKVGALTQKRTQQIMNDKEKGAEFKAMLQ